MKILGLHSAIGWNGNHADDMSRVHDSGATLFVDGKHIRSIDESRLTRNKQEGNYPELSIKYCLEDLTPEDIDIIAYSPTAVHLCNTFTASGDIATFLKSRFPNIKGPSSEDICYATTNRQMAVKSMSKICDCILVIGAENSSNSVRLVEVALSHGVKKAILIPNENKLDLFLKKFDPLKSPNIGLTAGASAPETLVQVLISKLKKDFEVNMIDHEVTKEDVKFNLPKILR